MHGLSVLIALWARRNPPYAVSFDMAEYDARKILTFLKVKRFARLGNRSVRCPTSCIHAVVIRILTIKKLFLRLKQYMRHFLGLGLQVTEIVFMGDDFNRNTFNDINAQFF